MTSDETIPAGVAFDIGHANDLGDEKVVELLVRGYIDRCLDAFQEVARGECDLDEAVGQIAAQAETLNDLFLGVSSITDVVLHPWNSPDQLGVYLRDAMGLDAAPDACVRGALIQLATLLMHTIEGNPQGWENEAENLRHDMRDLLLGRVSLDDGEGDGSEDGGTLPGLA